jgi:hypothetical protein
LLTPRIANLTENVLTHSSAIRVAQQALLDKKAKQWTVSGTKEYDVVKELFGLPAPKQGAASRRKKETGLAET